MLRSAASEERLSKQMPCVRMTAETVLFVDAISSLQGQTHASKLLPYILTAGCIMNDMKVCLCDIFDVDRNR